MNYSRIVTAGSGVMAPPNAELWTVNVNSGAASAVLTLYDANPSITASSVKIAVIDASTKSSHAYGAMCKLGIYAVLNAGNADCTIVYK